MFEIIVVAVALVAVKHFCRTESRSFSQNELPEIHQTGLSRSEYRSNAKVRYW